MQGAFVKGIYNIFELRKALSTAFQASVHHHPQPSLPLPEEKILGLSKPEEQLFYKKGRAAVHEEVGWWMSEKLELGADDLFRKTGVDVINECIGNIVTRLSECRLKTRSVNLRTRSLFVHVGKGDVEYRREIIRHILNSYMDEFPHIYQRWNPLPNDFDGSPQSAIRRTEAFRIPAFRRDSDTASQVNSVVLRRSERLASVKASSTIVHGQQGFCYRKTGELPVTPTKARKKATQDVEHPAKRRKLADVSNVPGPSRNNDESISAAPLKIKAKNLKLETRKKVRKFFGASDENAVSNGTRSRSKFDGSL
ncbi:hypothetical protein BT96DRAFT_974398 [Gymnopus androsaceus JB14]|uniref:Uncharacterized protein n=1 Tax=Gymnopus androsaceus JB14 TaxID=1447944 RepID=A0A6A4HY87_9AGAR|nr:hypothetical protein BT96DRAFT_974398 [Gymnopus androsaceus JB14]